MWLLTIFIVLISLTTVTCSRNPLFLAYFCTFMLFTYFRFNSELCIKRCRSIQHIRSNILSDLSLIMAVLFQIKVKNLEPETQTLNLTVNYICLHLANIQHPLCVQKTNIFTASQGAEYPTELMNQLCNKV